MKQELRYSASIVALGLAAGMAGAEPATAADVMAAPLPPAYYGPPVTNWGGWYLGAHLGNGEANFTGVFESTESQVLFEDLDLSGVVLGAHVGFNFDSGGATVWGVEADWSFLDWTDEANAASSSETGTGAVDMLASLRGRLGVVVDDDRSGLLYLTGGVAWADAEGVAYSDARFSDTVSQERVDFDDLGGVIGAGFEWAATDTFRLRMESLYYSFDENTALTKLSGANTGDFIGFDDAWVVRFGGSWYLN